MDDYGFRYESSQVPADYYSYLPIDQAYTYEEPDVEQVQFHPHDRYTDQFGDEEEIIINDDYFKYDFDDENNDEWIEEVGDENDATAYDQGSVPAQSPAAGNTQQVIIGGYPSLGSAFAMPDVADTQKHYCDLHPTLCRDANPLAMEANTTSANATVGEVAIGRMKHVDLSGVGFALMLILLVLLGLNVGWDKEASRSTAGKGGPTDERGTQGNQAAKNGSASVESGSGGGKGKNGKSENGETPSDQTRPTKNRCGKGDTETSTSTSSRNGANVPAGSGDGKGGEGTGQQRRGHRNGESSGRPSGERGRDGTSRTGERGGDPGEPSRSSKSNRSTDNSGRPGSDRRTGDPQNAGREGTGSSSKTGGSGADNRERSAAEKARERERAQNIRDAEAKKQQEEAASRGAERTSGKDTQRGAADRGKSEEQERDRKDRERRNAETARESGKNRTEAEREQEKEEAKRKAAQAAAEADAARGASDAQRNRSRPDAKNGRTGGSGAAVAEEDAQLAEAAKNDHDRKNRQRANRSNDAARQTTSEQQEDDALRRANIKDGLGQPSFSQSSKSSGTDWMTPQKLLIGLIILIPLLALLSDGRPSTSGGIITPPGRQSMPSSKWIVNEPPRQVINNVHAQGTDIPINIGTDGPFPHSTGAVHTEESGLRWAGPADPDRLFGMMFALGIVCLPLIIDHMRGWPNRKNVKTDYLSPTTHFIILAIVGVFLLWKFNQDFGCLARLRPGVVYMRNRAIYARDNIRTHLPGSVGATAEGAETLVWDMEDLVFGDGRELLGLILATAGLVFLSQRPPPRRLPKRPKYAQGLVQVLFVLGALLFGLLFMHP